MYIVSRFTFYNINRNRKPGLTPSAGFATDLENFLSLFLLRQAPKRGAFLSEGHHFNGAPQPFMRERTYSRECLPRKKVKAESSQLIPRKHTENPGWCFCLLRMIFCDSGHLHSDHKARHATKIYEQWQGPIETALVNNLNQWSG